MATRNPINGRRAPGSAAPRVVFECSSLTALHPDDWRRLDDLRQARAADGGCVLFAQLDLARGTMGVGVTAPKKEWSRWAKETLDAALRAMKKAPAARR